jgi:PAS domain S-box-containing protein
MVEAVSDVAGIAGEVQRLAALRQYEVLDTPREATFDEIVRIAALVCNTPIAVVNLIDEKRQFFKAEIGLGVRETPIDISICAHGLLQPGLFVVPDTTQDERFVCNPLVTGDPHLRFYAGALLQTPEGHPIGTVCVLDYQPRPDGVTPEQGETLKALARAAMAHLELRRASRDLAERQRELEAVTDTMPQIVWSNRPDGYHDYFNRRWYEFTGATPERSVGDGWNPKLHPEDRERAHATWRTALATGEPYEIEYRLRGNDGQFRWFMGRALPVMDDAGEIKRWYGTCTDVDDLKRAQAELQQQFDLNRAITDHASEAIFTLDPQGRTTFANPAAEVLLGWNQPDLVGSDLLDKLLPADEQRPFRMALSRTLNRCETVRHYEGTFTRKDGASLHVICSCAPILDADELRGAVLVVHDITERKKAERRMRESAERYRLAARATNDAIWDWEVESGKVLWNRAIERQFGHEVGETTAQWWKEQIHPDDRERVAASIDAVISGTGTHWVEDYRFLRGDGSYAFVFDRGYVLRGDEGRALRVIGAMLDISERKAAEERQNLLMRELHHRVRNTLATVQGMMGATARASDSFAEFKEAFSSRLAAIARSHTILTTADWQTAPLAGLLQAEIDTLPPSAASRIILEGPPLDLPANLAIVLSMAIHELAGNAIRHGSLSIPEGEVSVRWDLRGNNDLKCLSFEWVEQDGPPVTEPSQTGYGTILLTKVLPAQADASSSLAFNTSGVAYRLEAPLAKSA